MVSEDARTRLLRAAGPVFAEKGYQAATVRDICMVAGTNVASVNYHFGDKETLYIETVKLARQMRADRFPMPEWSADTPASERLRGFITTLLMRILAVDEVAWNTRLMLREMLEPTGVCTQWVQEYVQPMFRLLSGIIDELVPPSTPEHIRHKLCFSIVGQCLYYRIADRVNVALVSEQERREHFQPRQLAEHIVNFSLAAFGVVPPLGREGQDENDGSSAVSDA